MEFDLNEEQRALRDAARQFLDAEAPASYARAMMEDPRGYRDEVWKQMASLGWMALPFAEDHGGLGEGFIALSILLTEMGRVVLPGPYFSTVALFGQAVAQAGSPAQHAEVLPAICSGDLIATVAQGDVSSSAGTLSGEARFVPDGATAQRFVVIAGDQMFLTEPNDPGIAVMPVDAMDATRKVADVRFDGARAEPLSSGSARRVADLAAAGLASEMLGLSERALEMAVAYAKDRVQFDRPIGSFQAVKHRAADMLLDVESLRCAVYYAAWALERDHQDASLAASMAKAFASDAARRVTQSCIQIHGGIGFTWEHDAHLYFKRAKADEVAFGDAVAHRERMAGVLRDRYAG